MTHALTEAQVRRLAGDKGMRLARNRTRNPADPFFGGYMLVDDEMSAVVAGGHPNAFSLDLEQAADWLTND